MIYFDTDVLIHFLIKQNAILHTEANDVIEKAMLSNKFALSWLSIQETGFVLAKLNQEPSFISSKLKVLSGAPPLQYGLTEFNRAVQLAEIIGFKDFNDCLHTAIAEQYCTDFYTCNYKDFTKIQPQTSLNIHFLKAI
jgi:predicted nucleic acid-binding protein